MIDPASPSEPPCVYIYGCNSFLPVPTDHLGTLKIGFESPHLKLRKHVVNDPRELNCLEESEPARTSAVVLNVQHILFIRNKYQEIDYNLSPQLYHIHIVITILVEVKSGHD